MTCQVGNVFDFDPESMGISRRSLDAVLSDMAPDTSGIRDADAARSLELCERALDLALLLLKDGGNLLVKTFQGPDTNAYRARVKSHFEKVEIVRPKATKSASREVYIVGLNLKNR